jgi:truncated hemoglobin YjbI
MTTETAEARTLNELVGGTEALELAVDRFYERVVAVRAVEAVVAGVEPDIAARVDA